MATYQEKTMWPSHIHFLRALIVAGNTASDAFRRKKPTWLCKRQGGTWPFSFLWDYYSQKTQSNSPVLWPPQPGHPFLLRWFIATVREELVELDPPGWVGIGPGRKSGPAGRRGLVKGRATDGRWLRWVSHRPLLLSLLVAPTEVGGWLTSRAVQHKWVDIIWLLGRVPSCRH